MLSIFLFLFVKEYFQIGVQSPLTPGIPVILKQETPKKEEGDSLKQSVPYIVEPVVSGLSVPWSIVFTSSDRMLVTERHGTVRVVLKDKLLPTPIRTFTEVTSASEDGLMSATLDPDYVNNKYIYFCLTYEKNKIMQDKVVRVTDRENSLTDDMIVLDNIPAAPFHAGCRIKFSPDNKLYISTGDAQNKRLPQDLSSLGGKILRINTDGSIPNDNPIQNSPVYSYGHRNVQGFDWNPNGNVLIETEHGPSGNDGPVGGDEVNIIHPSQNYGWPLVSHEKTRDGITSPLLVFTPSVAPASGTFYKGSVFPQMTNTFLFGLLKGEGIMQVMFDSKHPDVILEYQKLPNIDVGRIRDVVEGPDGFVYFTTSNQDGRGKPLEGDDHIYRLIPKK